LETLARPDICTLDGKKNVSFLIGYLLHHNVRYEASKYRSKYLNGKHASGSKMYILAEFQIFEHVLGLMKTVEPEHAKIWMKLVSNDPTNA
jgi:hypothetical protein